MLANKIFHQPLSWVKPELDNTVKDAKKILENLSSDITNAELLQAFQQDLHLLKGSLEILNFDGAALLVEDMQKACNALQKSSSKNPEDTYEALLEATLALESYIDKLNKDQTDIPIALLPILNDLRASIEEPLLSENALFLPNLSIVPKTPIVKEEENEDKKNCLSDSAKSLRPYYQAALLSWYRNPTDQLSIQQMKLVARNLESTCYTPRNRQIWWILGGLFEALADKGLKSNIAIRLLLGQADRIIKSYSHNEQSYYEKTPPFNLLKNTLYYVSQSSSSGDRISTLKKVYQLDRVMPSETDLTQLRARLKGPNSETLQAISKELKKSLNQTKSTLDNFARNTPDNTDRLLQTLTPLKHVTDTLTLLSMGKEKQLLQEQITAIREIIESKTRPSKDKLMGIAAAIIQVDAGLKHIGFQNRKISDNSLSFSEDEKNMRKEISKSVGKLPETEYRFLRSKAILEAKTNVAHMKNHILAFISSDNSKPETLTPISLLLSEINGCLQILDSTYAANIVNALTDCIRHELQEKNQLDIDLNFDLLAETLVSLDYYLEAESEERASADQFLNLAADCLKQLGYSVNHPKPESKIPTLEAVVTHISEAPTRMKVNANTLLGDITTGDKDTNQVSNKASPENVVEFAPESPDSEVAEIFIEEATEELDKMAEQIKVLRIDLSDKETLSNIHRIYHTLKGSGKIAGAIHISDFSSTVEEYLNRVLCGAINLDQAGLSLLNDSYELLHILVDCFQNRTAPPSEFNSITEKAIRLMAPAMSATAEAITETPKIPDEVKAVTSSSSISEDEIKNLLATSFNQVALIKKYIEEKTDTIDLSPVPEFMNRCIEKLHSCAKVTDIKEFIQTTDLLSKYIGNLTRKQAPVNSETLDILSEFCATTHEILLELPQRLNANHIDANDYEAAEVQLPEPQIVESLTPEPAEEDYSLFNTKQTETLTENMETTENDAPIFTDDKLEEVEPKASEPAETFTEEVAETEEIAFDQDDDLDLINIFIEEAEELISKGHVIIEDNDFTQYDEKLLASIQRLLHTMKGSARMAGASSVGNISHAFESLAEAVITHQIEYPRHFSDLFRDTLDAINDMIDDIRSNKDIRLHETLFEKINALLTIGPDTIPDVEVPIVEIEQTAQPDKTENLDQELIETPNLTFEDKEPEASLESTSEPKENNEPQEVSPEKLELTDVDEVTTIEPQQSDTLLTEEDTPEGETKTIERDETPEAEAEAESMLESKQPKNKGVPLKISSDLIDSIVDQANSEASINNRLEDHVATIKTNLLELDKAISRSLSQMRDVQFNTSQQASRSSEDKVGDLNLSSFSDSQKSALRMMESIGDIENLHGVITKLTLETDNLIQQQKKTHTEMYETLLDTRLVNYSIQTQRIQRIVRQTSQSLNKKVSLNMEGTDGSIDRVLLDSIMGSLEHIIRNAIAHGIELPEDRLEKNKESTGHIQINFRKEDSQHVIEVKDDGAGMNPKVIREKAIEKNIIKYDTELSEDEILQLIFEPGFSTSESVDQISGRGVGMNVVQNDIEALGGHVSINSFPNEGSTFSIHLPFTVSRNKTLLVTANNNVYAIPTSSVVQTIPVSQAKLEALYSQENPNFEFEEQDYPLWYVDSLLNKQATTLPNKHQNAYLLILKLKHKRLALQVDQVNEARDSVLKPSAPQLTGIKGLAGTTILGNGKVVLILDMPSLFELANENVNSQQQIIYPTEDITDKQNISALIVDDSITVRKVSERFLNRNSISTECARDGMEALNVLKEFTPDVILLDIEMPNMDGLELAKQVKANSQLGHIPIIMITSRTGEQHRQAASEIGVDVFLGKPYQESELLGYIQALTGKRLRNA